jgi:phage gp37-like protein
MAGTKKADISVTTLIGPPKINQLKKRYSDQIVEDASDRVWALLGQSVHKVLELAGGEEEMTEKRLYKEINGWTLTGQTDLYEVEKGVLSDFKVTSVFSFLLGQKNEWVMQLNCNAMLWREYGYSPKKLQIVAILRDWQASKAEFDKEYPQCAVHIVDIPLWDNEEVVRYATERVKLHQAAAAMPDDTIPCCDPKERWAKPDTFAIKKDGNKRAAKVCETFEEAQQLLPTYGAKHSIEKRNGGDMRCERYCSVAPFCHYYKATYKSNE